LTFNSDRYPDEIDITTCSLREPSLLPPKDHTYVRSRVEWVRLCDELPEFSEQRGA